MFQLHKGMWYYFISKVADLADTVSMKYINVVCFYLDNLNSNIIIGVCVQNSFNKQSTNKEQIYIYIYKPRHTEIIIKNISICLYISYLILDKLRALE